KPKASAPPSTLKSCPVIYVAAGDAKKQVMAASSSGRPKRCRGILFSIFDFRSGSITCWLMSEGNHPGEIELTSILSWLHSMAKPLVMPKTADLDDEYGTTSEKPR